MDKRTAIANEVERLSCDYALYYRRRGCQGWLLSNCEHFPAAALVRLPILLAWLHLERNGRANRHEMCEMDLEPPVGVAGLATLLNTRRLPFEDVLVMMSALSDSLCANLVIQRIGIARLNDLFRGPLGLHDTRLVHKLVDSHSDGRDLENWISARDFIQLFQLRDELSLEERDWFARTLQATQDKSLLLRNLAHRLPVFCHITSARGTVLHDWGYSREADMFLLTQNVRDYGEVYAVFGNVGQLLLTA